MWDLIYMYVAQNANQWWASVNMVMAWNLLTSSAPIFIS